MIYLTQLGVIVSGGTSSGAALGLSGMAAINALPTDPIGAFNLLLTNVVAGSAIQVESVSGVVLYNGTAASSTVEVGLSAYAAGSPLNDLIIKVRKGSASPFYQPWRTQTTAIKGSQSIFVAQISDE